MSVVSSWGTLVCLMPPNTAALLVLKTCSCILLVSMATHQSTGGPAWLSGWGRLVALTAFLRGWDPGPWGWISVRPSQRWFLIPAALPPLSQPLCQGSVVNPEDWEWSWGTIPTNYETLGFDGSEVRDRWKLRGGHKDPSQERCPESIHVAIRAIFCFLLSWGSRVRNALLVDTEWENRQRLCPHVLV